MLGRRILSLLMALTLLIIVTASNATSTITATAVTTCAVLVTTNLATTPALNPVEIKFACPDGVESTAPKVRFCFLGGR